jgi:hypothetical protein
MTWWMLVLSFVWPVVQPAVQQTVQNVQQRVQQRMQPAPQQSSPAAPGPQYYSDGKNWYCYYQGQWWVWRQNQ